MKALGTVPTSLIRSQKHNALCILVRALALSSRRTSAKFPVPILTIYLEGYLPTSAFQWAVQSKTNPEISLILGISRRTVQKHLEWIYIKLGVENRTAAAMVAGTTQSTDRS